MLPTRPESEAAIPNNAPCDVEFALCQALDAFAGGAGWRAPMVSVAELTQLAFGA
jgi:hypothetical protein